MSIGQLRVRVRAYAARRSLGTAVRRRRTRRHPPGRRPRTPHAALRAAEADASDDETTRERLRTEAEQAKALAKAHDARAAELQVADDARAVWLAHTAETRPPPTAPSRS